MNKNEKNEWKDQIGKYIAVTFTSKIVNFIYQLFIINEEPFCVLVLDIHPSGKKVKLRHKGNPKEKWYSVSWYKIIREISEQKRLEFLAEDYVGGIPNIDFNFKEINKFKYVQKYAASQIQDNQNYPILPFAAMFITIIALLINPSHPESKSFILLMILALFGFTVTTAKGSHQRNSRYRKLILKVEAMNLFINNINREQK